MLLKLKSALRWLGETLADALFEGLLDKFFD